jgi:hypothetical protein
MLGRVYFQIFTDASKGRSDVIFRVKQSTTRTGLLGPEY